MSEEQKKELFIKHCLSDKEKVFLSNPLNTKHNAMFETFVIGLCLRRVDSIAGPVEIGSPEHEEIKKIYPDVSALNCECHYCIERNRKKLSDIKIP